MAARRDPAEHIRSIRKAQLLPFRNCYAAGRALTSRAFWLQVVCFYFVFTVFATVGFGDVTAVNTTERVPLFPAAMAGPG